MNRNRNNLEANKSLNNSNYGASYRMNEIYQNNDVNPFNKFSPMSANSQVNNFNAGFSNPTPLLIKTDYSNQNNVIHNNLKDNVLGETITEYTINIDSFDRDLCEFPNPYSFVVRFNPNSSIIKSTKTIENGKIVYESQRFRGASQPFINKEFRNVKYVKLDDIILPQYGNITFDCESNKYVFDKHNKLVNDRFIMVTIEEFEDSQSRVYSTSDSSDRIDYTTGENLKCPVPFCQVYPDTEYGKYFYYGGIIGGVRVYKGNNLGNINRMTIKLHDSFGVPLQIDDLFSIEELQKANSCDPRNPMHKYHQFFMSFTIGVIENELATVTKFEK